MKLVNTLLIRFLTSSTLLYAQLPTIPQYNLQKLSPSLQQIIGTQNAPQNSLMKTQGNMLTVILRSQDASAINGLKIRSVVGDVTTAEISDQQLASLLDRRIEYIQEDKLERPSAYSNAQLMDVEEAHRGIIRALPLRGENTMIAIYDSGIDWKHLDFRRSDDTTKSRILFIWDQTAQSDALHYAPSGYNYGVEYQQSDLNAELSGASSGFVKTLDRTGHGTGVAGVAAANGQSSSFGFTGVAPEADLIIIKGGDDTFSEAKIIDAMSYVTAKAKELDRPVVLNLSLGSQFGAHDGSRLYERAIDAFSSQPGHAVVVAAGNDGDNPIHAELPSSSSVDSTIIHITIPTYTPQTGDMNDIINIEFWYDSADSIIVRLISPTGIAVTASTRQATQFMDSQDGTIILTNASYGPSTLNGKNAGNIRLIDYNGNIPKSGLWNVIVKNARTSLKSSVHFWLTEGHVGSKQVCFDRTSPALTYTHLVSSPGNSMQAITVGSFNTANIWTNIDGNTFELGELNSTASSFSAAGPRIDGVVKPEVLAPGTALGTTLSEEANCQRSLIHKDGLHFAASGTSYSAPQITGIVALMFQVNPTMTSEQIKQTFQKSASMEQALQSAITSKNGYGKINGITALMSLLEIEYLPPEFIGITASVKNPASTQIQWTQSSTMQLKGFEILRRTTSDKSFEVIASYKENAMLKPDGDTLFQFIDAGAANASYIIREVDALGHEKEFGIIVPLSTLDISNKNETLPQYNALLQNYPNPFNPTTVISYQLSAIGNVSLRIYDMLGREVAVLAEGVKESGNHKTTFNASALASGIYFSRLEVKLNDGGEFVKTIKMQMIK